MSKKDEIALLKKVEKMLYDRRRYIDGTFRRHFWLRSRWDEGHDEGFKSAENLVFNLRKKLEDK